MPTFLRRIKFAKRFFSELNLLRMHFVIKMFFNVFELLGKSILTLVLFMTFPVDATSTSTATGRTR